MVDKQEIGNRFKEIRNELNISQKDFAAKLEVKQQTISQIETGIISPSLELLDKITSKYCIQLSYIIYGEGPMLKKETQAQVLPVPGINSNELALLKSKDNLIEEKDKIIKMLEKEVTRLEAENEFLKQSNQDSKYSTKALFTKLNK